MEVVFEVGDIVSLGKDEAIVTDVLDRAVDVLRRSGPSKGIPKFVHPSELMLVRKGAKAKVRKKEVEVPIEEEKMPALVVSQLSLLS